MASQQHALPQRALKGAGQLATSRARRVCVLVRAARAAPSSTASSSAQGQAFRLSNLSSSASAGVRPAEAAAAAAPGSWLPSWASGAIVGLAVAMLYNKLTTPRAPAYSEGRARAPPPPAAAGRQRKDAFNDVMKGVNTVPVPSLSDEAINAARARRQKERANHKLQLEDIDIPANHPWAVRAPQADSNQVRAPLPPRRLRVQPTQDGADGAQPGGAGGVPGPRPGRRQMLDNSSSPQQQHRR